jgi:GAF domain-containing protein
MARGRPVGVMTAGRGPGAPPFTAEDLSTLTDFATQAAVALEHARLFDEATRNAARYQALLEVSAAVSSTLEVDRVLDLVVDRCRALLGVAAVGVMQVDRNTGVLTYERGRGLSREFIATLRMRLGEGTTGRAVEERVPVWSEDILNDPALAISAEARALIEREGYRAVLSVPLLTKGAAQGAIAAYWWEPHTPSAEEICSRSTRRSAPSPLPRACSPPSPRRRRGCSISTTRASACWTATSWSWPASPAPPRTAWRGRGSASARA